MRLTGEAHGDTSMEAINDMELGYTVDAAGRRGEIQIRHEGRRRMVVLEFWRLASSWKLTVSTRFPSMKTLLHVSLCGRRQWTITLPWQRQTDVEKQATTRLNEREEDDWIVIAHFMKRSKCFFYYCYYYYYFLLFLFLLGAFSNIEK